MNRYHETNENYEDVAQVNIYVLNVNQQHNITQQKLRRASSLWDSSANAALFACRVPEGGSVSQIETIFCCVIGLSCFWFILSMHVYLCCIFSCFIPMFPPIL